ncbi:MAG TPA: sigma-54 dependent transcriptional regulator [Candidatus Brocadiales bacterium]|nr:sigma-54 dependent transcriptional regulator [Candidatus Brocadiales bacterium]
MTGKARVLVVDDEVNLLKTLSDVLNRNGYEVAVAKDGPSALGLIEKNGFDIALLDIRMPHMNGVELLERIKARNPDVEVIIMTAYGTIETAIKSIKLGAYAYILKPLDIDDVLVNLKKITQMKALAGEARFLQDQLLQEHSHEHIIGKSKQIQGVVETIKKVAPSDSTVLIIGPSGAGKEMVADAVHYSSKRCSRPYLKINCAAFPETLLESELFGYEKGAFTGADKQKKGKFEVANGGTLFLDEIGDMPLPMQAKLLRVLEKGEFERLGGNEVIRVDVRFVAATNQNLTRMLQERRFRSDLFYRLNTVIINLPPLVDRSEDIPLLVDHFLAKFSREMSRKQPDVSPEAVKLVLSYPWPGNIRELANAIERAVIFCEKGVIKPHDLPLAIHHGSSSAYGEPHESLPDDLRLDAVESRHISEVLRLTGGNKNEAARRLGIHRETLYKKIRKFNLPYVGD